MAATPEGDLWHATVQALAASEAITALVRTGCNRNWWRMTAATGGCVERESLNQPMARERLRAALEAADDTSQISVEVGPVTDIPARRNAAAEQERQRVAQDTVANDPFVQTLVRDYGAKSCPVASSPLNFLIYIATKGIPCSTKDNSPVS